MQKTEKELLGRKIEKLKRKMIPESCNLDSHIVTQQSFLLSSHELDQFSKTELQQKFSDGLFQSKMRVVITEPIFSSVYVQHLKRGSTLSLFTYLVCMGNSKGHFLVEYLVKKKDFRLKDFIEEGKTLLLIGNYRTLSLLKSYGLIGILNEETIKEVLVTLILTADINRIIFLNEKEFLGTDKIVEILHTPGLLVNTLNFMYSKVGQLCRQYNLSNDDDDLKAICDLEKKYINVFRLIRSNGIELSQLCNVTELIQNAFNTYLYYLIKYLVENTSENDRTNVVFYHYSNFPVENKVVMSPIYNDRNFQRIQELLRDNLFIKRIVKKKIGKKTVKLNKIQQIEYGGYQVCLDTDE